MEHEIRQRQCQLKMLLHTTIDNKDPLNPFGQTPNDSLEFIRRWLAFGWKFAYNLPLSLFSYLLLFIQRGIFNTGFGGDWQNLFRVRIVDQKINISSTWPLSISEG